MDVTWLADAARRTGRTVVEHDFWKISGRPGAFAPRGVLIHHTGTIATEDRPFPTETTLIRGRPDLKGPLCAASPSYDGVLHIIAAGRGNHAGTAKASGPMPAGDGNALYVGLELDYSGVQDPSGAQYGAAVALAGEICHQLGVPASHVRGHRETSVTGKWDPGRIDMDRFRIDVTDYLAGQTAPPAPPPLRRLEKDVLTIARDSSDPAGAIWVGDGVQRRHLVDDADVTNTQHFMRMQGYTEAELAVKVFGDVRPMGRDVQELQPVDVPGLANALLPQLVQQLADTTILTADEAQAASEAAIRRVLGSLTSKENPS